MSCSPTGREVDVDMSSDDDFAAAKFAAAQAEYAQHLADKAAKKARRAQVQKQQRILVPDSPSPRELYIMIYTSTALSSYPKFL